MPSRSRLAGPLCAILFVCIAISMKGQNNRQPVGDDPVSEYVEMDCNHAIRSLFYMTRVADEYDVSYSFETFDDDLIQADKFDAFELGEACQGTSEMEAWYLLLEIRDAKGRQVPFQSVAVMMPSYHHRKQCDVPLVASKVLFMDESEGDVVSCFAPLNCFLAVSKGVFKQRETPAKLQMYLVFEKVPMNQIFDLYVRFNLEDGRIVHRIIQLQTIKPQEVISNFLKPKDDRKRETLVSEEPNSELEPIKYNNIILYENRFQMENAYVKEIEFMRANVADGVAMYAEIQSDAVEEAGLDTTGTIQTDSNNMLATSSLEAVNQTSGRQCDRIGIDWIQTRNKTCPTEDDPLLSGTLTRKTRDLPANEDLLEVKAAQKKLPKGKGQKSNILPSGIGTRIAKRASKYPEEAGKRPGVNAFSTEKAKPQKNEQNLQTQLDPTVIARYPKVALLTQIGAYQKCGTVFSCFFWPENCRAKQNCFAGVLFRTRNNRLEVILYGTTKAYVAVGFSKDRFMGDEPVVLCKRGYGIDRVGIWRTYNTGFTEKRGNHLEKTHDEVNVLKSAYYNGVVSCHFSLPMSFKYGGNSKTVDFNQNKYHILFALGESNEEPNGPGSIVHHSFHMVSRGAIDLKKGLLAPGRRGDGDAGDDGTTYRPVPVTSETDHGEDSTATDAEISPRSVTFLKWHQCLCVLACVFFFPMGIYYSRYGQQAFPYVSFCYLPSWIIVHITCQVLGFVCLIVACILMYVDRWGAALGTSSSTYHLVVASIAFILAVFQLLGGLYIHRLKVTAKNVPMLVKSIHYGMGHVIVLIGCVEFIRGPYLPNSFVACSFSFLGVYFVLFYGGAHLLLMFNTDYLMRLQGLPASLLRAFFGPAVSLKLSAPRDHYNLRRATLWFMWFICFMYAGGMIVIIAISDRTCHREDPGYVA